MGDAPVWPAAQTASSTIRQIGLPVSRESRFSRAFVSGRIDATNFGYSLVFRGRPFASASAAGRPGPRFRFPVAISCPDPPYYRLTFLAIYNSTRRSTYVAKGVTAGPFTSRRIAFAVSWSAKSCSSARYYAVATVGR